MPLLVQVLFILDMMMVVAKTLMILLVWVLDGDV
jgi:hypothetical protein